MTVKRLSGWGRTAWTSADVRERPESLGANADFGDIGARGAVARGLGRAYGAAAQNSGGVVFDMTQGGPDMAEAIDLNVDSGLVSVDAGVSLDDLLKFSVPKGWFVPVTPGTRFVTIGGAVASDVHGKNHHIDGSFGNFVREMDIVLADGRSVTLSPSNHPDWFWATIGGMGLTGIVRRVTFQMLRIESSLVRVETIRFPDLQSGLELMSDKKDDQFRYSVAWVDIAARGRHLGRGILTRGDHAKRAEDTRPDPLAYNPKVRFTVPPIVPNWFLNPVTIRAFNELWYRKSPARPHVGLESIPKFFHPLDGVNLWNRVYGSRGFIQYQIIVPFDRTELLTEFVHEFSDARIGSFLAVLKRMGESNRAPLSFPTSGWTLTVDVASGTRGLPELLASFDQRVLEAGGRHYLAKDAHVTSHAVSLGYPRVDEWKAARREMDPSGVWRSDLGRRLGLVKEQV